MFSSSMFVETPENEIMGEIHMDWHVYRRRSDELPSHNGY